MFWLRILALYVATLVVQAFVTRVWQDQSWTITGEAVGPAAISFWGLAFIGAAIQPRPADENADQWRAFLP